MADNTEIEVLRKQLEEEKAKREQLEFQIQYEDKITGLYNRKYLEKLIEEGKIECQDPNFSIVFTQVENLKAVNENEGNDAGDRLLLEVTGILKEYFGDTTSHYKLIGAKFCSMVVLNGVDFSTAMNSLYNSLKNLKESHPTADFTVGTARLEDHAGAEIEVLLREAEYELHMKSAEKDVSFDDGNKQKNVATKTILMIDDSLVQLRTQQAILKEEYKLLMSTSGLEGYEIAKAKRPDLILLDYNMPIVDGKRIMELLRKSVATKDIPVIFVSGVSEKGKFLDVAKLNPAGYLLKPVSKNDLLREVKKALNV